MEDVAAVIAGAKKMRWDFRARPHYEVWYTTVSQLSTGAGFWIRYAIVAPEPGPNRVEVWFTSFIPDLAEGNVAVAQEYPSSISRRARNRFRSAWVPRSWNRGG